MCKFNSCCFIGHRKIEETKQLKDIVINTITNLIENKNVATFFLGSKSQFNDFCVKILTDLKAKYPHIKRIYVRAEHQHISDNYKSSLLKTYDDTYYPKRIVGAGKAVYVERNYEMIDKSHYCIVYYNKNYAPPMRKRSNRDLFAYQPKSGTELAYNYAIKKGCVVINTSY